MDDQRPGGSAKHGINWWFSYAFVRPRDLQCGWVTNPEAETMVDLAPCGRVATYEFRCNGDRHAWCSACSEHASVIREAGLVEQIRSLREAWA